MDSAPASAPSRGLPARLGLAGTAGIAGAIAASQVLFGLGWDNHLVSDDWYFAYQASKIGTLAELLPFFSFDTTSFVRPTQWLLTTALYHLFGVDPHGYHAVSQVLDLTNAALVWLLTRQLLALAGTADGATGSLAGGLAAVLFLFSWRHHEAVFWFSAVNELLACAFRLVVLNCLAWWLRTGRAFSRVWLAVVVGSMLAVLSKESAATLPVEALLVVGLAYSGPRRSELAWRRAAALAAVPTAIVLAWTWVFLRTSIMLPGTLGRGVSQTLRASPGEWVLRLLQFVNASYAGTEGLSAMPVGLALELVLLLGLVGLAVARGQRLWLFAVAWSLVAVVPYVVVSHGPDVGLAPVLELGIRGDRFLYHGAAGASLVIVASGLWLAGELAVRTRSARWRRLGGIAALVVLLAYVAVNAARLRAAEAEWDTAGRIVRRVVADVRREWPAPRDTLCLARLPHVYRDKPVYRNGIAESLFLAYGHEDFAVERYENLADSTARARCAVVLVYAGLDEGLVRARIVSRPGPARRPRPASG